MEVPAIDLRRDGSRLREGPRNRVILDEGACRTKKQGLGGQFRGVAKRLKGNVIAAFVILGATGIEPLLGQFHYFIERGQKGDPRKRSPKPRENRRVPLNVAHHAQPNPRIVWSP